jgi:hypothetical protein
MHLSQDAVLEVTKGKTSVSQAMVVVCPLARVRVLLSIPSPVNPCSVPTVAGADESAMNFEKCLHLFLWDFDTFAVSDSLMYAEPQLLSVPT